MKLDKIIVGPEKCGTTLIYEYVKTCGLALPREKKETLFWKVQSTTIADYLKNFSNDSIRIEVSPSYFSDQAVVNRLVMHNPNLKVLIIRRDALERSVSHFKHHLNKRRIFMDEEMETIHKKYPEIINHSNYEKHINMWISAFGSCNVSVIEFELLKSNIGKFKQKLDSFLECESDLDTLFSKVNETRVLRNSFLAHLKTVISTILHHIGLGDVSYRAGKTELVKRLFYTHERYFDDELIKNKLLKFVPNLQVW